MALLCVDYSDWRPASTNPSSAVVIRILELIHEALRTGRTVSKRYSAPNLSHRNDLLTASSDIYYRDPALFGSQSHVNQYVDDIAFTFGVPRSSLNVNAVAKGLVAGAITLNRRDGSSMDVSQDQEGTLIAPANDVLSINLDRVQWIIVIEKEASFRTITTGPLWPLISTQGAVITGKGYPDIATRALLHHLTNPSSRNNFAAPPIYGLSDFDPDGLAIMSTYKHGSEALAHENAHLVCPTLKWVGLRSDSIAKFCVESGDIRSSQGLLTMTLRDRKKAQQMLEWKVLNEKHQIDGWRLELQVMLMLNVKAELQLLEANPDGTMELLEGFLPNNNR